MIFYLDQIDRLEERENIFFNDCKKKLIKTEDKEVEFVKIKEDYKKAIEDATEKVQVAEECYGLVDRYLRKLDEELHKFKMELEADNRGITEILEKQSLEMDAQNVSHLKENRLPKKLVRFPYLNHKLYHVYASHKRTGCFGLFLCFYRRIYLYNYI